MQRTFTKLLTIGAVFLSIHSFAQLDPYFTHYMLNKLSYNPAVAGEKEAICVNGITHQQWGRKMKDESTQFKKEIGETTSGVNPATSAFSITAPILKDNRMGVGLQVITDKLGYNTALYMRGSVSYKHRFGRRLINGQLSEVLAGGIDFGTVQIGMDGTKYNPVNSSDPVIPTSLVKGNKFDLGFGLYYTNQTLFDGAYAGVSMTHLTAPKVDVAGLLNFDVQRYLYILAGTQHQIGGNMMLLPSLLVRNSPGSGLQVDLSARLEINQKFMGGINLRSSDAIGLLLGYYIQPNFYAGYSYDITALSGMFKYTSAGTHEIFLSYCFDLTPPPPKSPRPMFNVRYAEGYTY
jgi:type IX secretion system PorP/SprF family membrane protein